MRCLLRGSIMKKIIYTRPDGGLDVVHPVVNTHPVREDITEDEALQRAWDRLPAYAIDPIIVEESAIPTDRSLRNAWKHIGNGVVKQDLIKARELTKERLRRERAPLLAQLDIDYMRADELNDTAEKRKLATKKQQLRNVTDNVNTINSIDELRLLVVGGIETQNTINRI